MFKRLSALLMTAGLTACGSGGGSETANVPDSWKPEGVKLTCSSGDCPDGTGVVIFGRNAGEGRFEISRCSATLISGDSILTNAHCDDYIPNATFAYFILHEGATGHRILKLANKVFEERGADRGLDRDLAIFRLARPSTAAPRRIARAMPARIDKLVSFSVDQESGDNDFTSLKLVKKECRIDRHVPALASGYADRKLAISLFDCDIRRGNSGAALFIPEDLTTIHALVHSIWDLGEKVPEAQKARSLFYLLPSFMHSRFAMAERLHCGNIPGQEPPAELCPRVDMDQTIGEKWRVMSAGLIDQYLGQFKAKRDELEWTASVIRGDISLPADTLPGVALFPHPFCQRGKYKDVRVEMPLLRIGLQASGEPDHNMAGWFFVDYRFSQETAGEVLLTVNVKNNGRGPLNISYGETGFLSTINNFIVRPANAGVANQLKAPGKLKLPKCGPDARERARQAALESVRNHIKFSRQDFL